MDFVQKSGSLFPVFLSFHIIFSISSGFWRRKAEEAKQGLVGARVRTTNRQLGGNQGFILDNLGI